MVAVIFNLFSNHFPGEDPKLVVALGSTMPDLHKGEGCLGFPPEPVNPVT